MEDSANLSQEDKNKLESLKKELNKLKKEHKGFAAKKSALTVEEKDKWKLNGQRTNQIYIEIKDLRHKNILEAGRNG
jgi:hypothetical protein